VLPLIAYVAKSQTGGLWICGVPNKVTVHYRFPDSLSLCLQCLYAPGIAAQYVIHMLKEQCCYASHGKLYK